MLYTLPGTNDASFFLLGGRCCRQQYFQWVLVTVKYTKILLRMYIIIYMLYTQTKPPHQKMMTMRYSSKRLKFILTQFPCCSPLNQSQDFFFFFQNIYSSSTQQARQKTDTAFSASKIVKSTNTVIVDTEEDKMSGN